MRKQSTATPKQAADLAADARALMEATAHLTGQKVQKARQRLARSLKNGIDAGEDVLDASADRATHHARELRDRVTAALDHGKELYDEVHDDVVSGTKAADETVHAHPYPIMGISLGLGALVGYILSSRLTRNGQ